MEQTCFSQNNKVSSKLQYVMGKMNRPWFKFIVKILYNCGLSFILYQQNVNIQWLKKTVFLYTSGPIQAVME